VQFICQFQGNADFADTNCVNPCRPKTLQGIPYFAGIKPEPLTKILPVTTAPDHFDDVSG
jgi:hypothetical protein